VPRVIAAEVDTRKTLGYRAFRGTLRVVWVLMFRPRVIGADNIPLEGRVIIAPLHRSNIDFAFVLFLSRRKAFFMAKDSLFSVPVLGRLVSAMGAFPVKRGSADREAMTISQGILEADEALVLFPEGTRQSGDAVTNLHNGAMFLATRTGSPVVPVGIAQSERAMPVGAKFPRPVRVTLVVGQAIHVPLTSERTSRHGLDELTETLRSRLEQCYAEARKLSS
jgi:1-acyl-sn-glycerol-3-phosphate acyltransferase